MKESTSSTATPLGDWLHSIDAVAERELAATYGTLRTGDRDAFQGSIAPFLQHLDALMEQNSPRFRSLGQHLALANFAALFDETHADGPMRAEAQHLTLATLRRVLAQFNRPSRLADTNLLPFLHVFTAFLERTMEYREGVDFAASLPWGAIAVALNRIAVNYAKPYTRGPIHLPEDVALRGAQSVAPDTGLSRKERAEVMDRERQRRLLKLGIRIAARTPWLCFDPGGYRFQAARAF